MPTLVAMLQGRFRPFRLIREGAGDGAFWLGRGLELVADWVFLVALIGATWMLTRDVPAVALVVLARLLPRPLILLAGGAFARRIGGNALVLLDVGRAVVAGAVALTVLGGSSGVLALGVSAAIYGVFTALAAERRVRLLGALAPPTRLGEMAALDGLVARLAFFAGPLVAAALIGLGDLRVALLASAVASVGAAALVAMRGGDVARSRAEQVPVTSVALREVIGHPRLLLFAVVGLVFGAAATSLTITLLPLTSSPADLGSPAVLGLLLAAVGLGTVLGPLPTSRLLGRVPPPLFAAGLLGVLAFGVAIVGLTASAPIIAIVLLVIGVAAASQEALTVIAVRRSSPSGLAAAVARAMVVSSGAGQVIGAAVVAAGARTLGVTGALIATAFVGLAVTVLLALILEGPSAFRPLRAEAAR